MKAESDFVIRLSLASLSDGIRGRFSVNDPSAPGTMPGNVVAVADDGERGFVAHTYTAVNEDFDAFARGIASLDALGPRAIRVWLSSRGADAREEREFRARVEAYARVSLSADVSVVSADDLPPEAILTYSPYGDKEHKAESERAPTLLADIAAIRKRTGVRRSVVFCGASLIGVLKGSAIRLFGDEDFDAVQFLDLTRALSGGFRELRGTDDSFPELAIVLFSLPLSEEAGFRLCQLRSLCHRSGMRVRMLNVGAPSSS